MGATGIYWSYIGIMGKKMENIVTRVYWGCIRIMERNMETIMQTWDNARTYMTFNLEAKSSQCSLLLPCVLGAAVGSEESSL